MPGAVPPSGSPALASGALAWVLPTRGRPGGRCAQGPRPPGGAPLRPRGCARPSGRSLPRLRPAPASRLAESAESLGVTLGDALGRRDRNRRAGVLEGSSAARFFGVASASGRGEGGASASLHVAPGLGGAEGSWAGRLSAASAQAPPRRTSVSPSPGAGCAVRREVPLAAWTSAPGRGARAESRAPLSLTARPRAHHPGIRETQAWPGGKSVFNFWPACGSRSECAGGGVAAQAAQLPPSLAQEGGGPFPELSPGTPGRLQPCLC